MSDGKPCERHRIPVNICSACRGAAEERERIIALLKENLRPIAASGDDPESFGWREGMGYALALIKGENE